MKPILTYSDYVNAKGNEAQFILQAINEWKVSDTFKRAVMAQAYYERKNHEIVNRVTFTEKFNLRDIQVKTFKMRSGFFRKMIMQEVQYLLGNGVSVDDEYKPKLGATFDKDLQKAGLYAKIDGVVWCFWNIDRMCPFRVADNNGFSGFVPIFDDHTGNLMLGIRFLQIEDNKPMYVEVYGQEGITKYCSKGDDELCPVLNDQGEPEHNQPYKQKIRKDILGSEIIDTESYSTIPIFPLYANETQQSELTDGLKEDIDAYDFVDSDLVNGITLIEGIYWKVKNLGGEDAARLLQEIQNLKIALTDTNLGTESDNSAIEIPYGAKQMALELWERKMHNDTMTLDLREITGGSLTNVAISVAMTNLDLKTDMFEWQCVDLVEKILGLLGYSDVSINFKRRTLVNDTEIIGNLSNQLADGYVDEEFCIDHAPNIPDEEKEDLKERIALNHQEESEEMFALEDEEFDDEDSENLEFDNEPEANEEEPNKKELDDLFAQLDSLVKGVT